MALSRRTGQRFQASIWPGFVDAMTGLLLVLMFVLTIFMVVQFVLRETITGQESELNELSTEILAISEALGLEREKVVNLEVELGSLKSTLDETNSELNRQSGLITVLTSERDKALTALRGANAKIASFEEQVAGLLAAQSQDGATIATLEITRETLLSEQEALNLALASARDEIDQAAEEARRKAAEREALEALIASLQTQKRDSEQRIASQASELKRLKDVISEKEAAQLISNAAAEALRQKLAGADAELTAMGLALEEQRKKAEDLLITLAAAESAKADYEEQLKGTLLALSAAKAKSTAQSAEFKDLQKLSETLRSDIKDAEIALAAAYAQQVKLEVRIKELEAQILAEQQAAQTAQNIQQDLEIARSELNDRLSLTLLNLTQTQFALDGSEATVADLKRLLNHLKNDSAATRVTLEERLAATIDKLSRATADRDSLQEQLNTMFQRVKSSDEEMARAKDLLAILKEKARVLETNNLSLKQEVYDLNAAFGTLQSERDSLRDKLANTLLNLTKSETDLQNAVSNSDDLSTALNALKSDTEEKIGDIETELANALASVAEAQKDRAALKSQLAEAILNLTESETNQEKLNLALDALSVSSGETVATVEKELARTLAALATSEAQAEDLQVQLRSAIAAKIAAEVLSDARLNESAEKEILRQEALKKLRASEFALSKSEEEALKLQKQTTALNAQVAELRKQLGKLQALLDDLEAEDRDSKVQLQNLGNRLNAALAKAAAEERRRRKLEEEERKRLEKELIAKEELASQALDLAKYKSEFFGRMKDFLEDREGVRIVGDRFIFSSEVLFAPGKANLSSKGENELLKVGQLLNAIMSDIPEKINWVIRVDGHTDKSPIRYSPLFADNWELSQARALSVVRFMISELYIPPARLSANGFGEFQPLNPADTPEARAQNRRIELKLTEK